MTLVAFIICIVAVAVFVILLPLKGAGQFKYEPPLNKFNEAHAVLSRRLLIRETDAYTSYYNQNPGYREADDRAREAPGLLSEKALYYHASTFAASRANFEIVDFLGNLTLGNTILPGHGPELILRDNPPSRERNPVNPKKVAEFISNWLKQTGAHSVGYTALKEYHLYSHKGRGPSSGKPIPHIHENAIAITVEMDHRMMQSAPAGSSVMESSEQYLRSGVLALKAAAFIRELGYEATAHIDGKYELICPLVAVDAGLGTLGRMGLLMTPDLGPRVRISVVTTNMPVPHSHTNPDRTIIHFCHHCKKCARTCPAGAIPEGPQKPIDGIDRWQINSEKCYYFWTLSGTDCGRCITACPYSHPDTLFHRFIRWGIKNNLVFRRLAIKFDDILYGRKPPVRPLPDWTDILDKL